MTRYEEMNAAAAQARSDFNAYQERPLNKLLWLVQGFINHCVVPEGRVTFLRWNGLTGDDWRYVEPADGGKWAFLAAIRFEEEDECWHIGLHVNLSDLGTLPQNWFFFALCVSELQGQVMVRMGFVGKPRPLDTSDAVECVEFYEEIVSQFGKRLKEPRRKPGQR